MALAPPTELFSVDFLHDPYPTFAWLRQERPVYWSESFEAFLITRFDDCVRVLTDPDQFGPVPDVAPRRPPADHVQYRNILARAFNAEYVAQLGPMIQGSVDQLVETFVSRGEVNLMAEFAERLPTLVLAEMLGIPTADQPMFHAWADVYTTSLTNELNDAQKADFLRTIRELVGYFAYRIEDRRRHPGEDLVTRLLHARYGTVELSAAQILSLCEQFMVAGRDLTTGLIGNGVRALLLHPDQLQRVSAQDELLEAAIEETLRWDSPVLGQPRTNRVECELRGVRMQPGDLVVVMFAAANRDPLSFPLPDVFDLDRPNAALHLAFGRGIHFCLGAPLARLEATVALRTLFARLPNLRLAAGQSSQRRVAFAMLNLRTFGSLPVAFDTDARRRTLAYQGFEPYYGDSPP
jgi:cytochrome P450